MTHKLLLPLLLAVCSLTAKAQSVPVYTIMNAIETNALAELPGHPEWGMQTLRQHVHSSMPSSVQLTLPEASQTTLPPHELYAKRHASALVYGKLFTCSECPKLHVDIIATATPVTADGVCLVNYHMVRPIVDRNAAVKGDSIYFVADRDGQVYPLTDILATSRDEDAAVIRVDTRGNSLEAIPLGQPALVGQHINLISHPKKMVYTYTQGYVSRNTIYNYPGYPILDLMEVTADFAEGSSGGPVMDDQGNLVGMVKGTTTIFYDEERRNPQMVLRVTIPIKPLRKLLGLK